MKEDSPYKGITKEEVQKAVQEVFRTERKIDLQRWYKTLSPQQQKSVDNIFKAEVEAQIAKLDAKEQRRIIKGMSVGEVCRRTELVNNMKYKFKHSKK